MTKRNPARTGVDRYVHKRVAGLSPVRDDGSTATMQNDAHAAAAAAWACERLHLDFDTRIGFRNPGQDARRRLFGREYSFQIVWQGINATTGYARSKGEGYLIVNPDEPQRWAHVYVSVYGLGQPDAPFSFNGWITHDRFLHWHQTDDLGFGPKWVVPNRVLWVIESLLPVLTGSFADSDFEVVRLALTMLELQADDLGGLDTAYSQGTLS